MIQKIRAAFERFEKWHRSWRSYKQPKTIYVVGPSERVRKVVQHKFPSDKDVGIDE